MPKMNKIKEHKQPLAQATNGMALRLPGVFGVIYFINVMLFTISQKKASV